MIITKTSVRRGIPYDVELTLIRGCVLTARARSVAIVHESPTIARAILMVVILDAVGVDEVIHEAERTTVLYRCGAVARTATPEQIEDILDMAWLPDHAEEWMVERVKRHVRGELAS